MRAIAVYSSIHTGAQLGVFSRIFLFAISPHFIPFWCPDADIRKGRFTDGATPLFVAAKNSNAEVAALILEAGLVREVEQKRASEKEAGEKKKTKEGKTKAKAGAAGAKG